MTPTPDDAMPSELERMICNYTKNDRNAINRFLGAAQLCGYHLNRADKPHAEAVERKDIVPGMMYCAKCKFCLTRRTLYVQSGNVGSGTNETEPCPNGCGPLWPVTWKMLCDDYEERLVEEIEKNKALPQPVIPDGYVLMPIDPDDVYVEKVCFKACVCGGIFESVHKAMISAASKEQEKGNE